MPPAATAALFYAIVLSVVFGAILFGGKTVVHGDALSVGLPFQQLFVESLKQGTVPLWSHRVYGGHPVFAEGQGAFAHPLTWLVFAPLSLFSRSAASSQSEISLGLLTAHGVFHYVCVWIAAMGTFGLARQLRQSPSAALFAGMAVGGSQAWLLLTMNATIAGATAWVPLLLLTIERWWQRPDSARSLAMGTAGALVILAGYPQALHAAVLFALTFLLARTDRLWWRAPWRHLATGVFAIFVATALSAVQWIPTLELAAMSIRASGTSISYSHPFIEQLRGSVSSLSGHNEMVPGLGSALVFGLALFGLRRSRIPLALALTTLFLYQLAMGEHSAVFRALHSVLPGLDRFRIVWMYSTVGLLGLALLAGMGLDALETSTRASRAAFIRLGVIAVVVGAISWAVHLEATPVWTTASALTGLVATSLLIRQKRTRCVAPLLLGLLVVEIFVARIPLQRFGDRDAFRHPPATARFLHEQKADRLGFEVINFPHTHPAVTFAPPSRENIQQLAQRFLVSLGDGSSPLWKLASIRANLALPLARRSSTTPLIEAEARGEPPTVAGLRFIDAIGLRYFVFNWEDKEQPHAGDFVKVFDESQYGFWIRENPSARPMLQLVPASRAQWVPNPREALAAFRSPGGATLVLEGEPAPGFDASSVANAPRGQGSIARSRIERGYYRAHVRVATPSYLFVADAPYPGWEATIDGEPSTLHPANVIGKAVPVPPGLHTIELRFSPRSVRLGAAISGLALVATAALGWRLRGRNRSRAFEA